MADAELLAELVAVHGRFEAAIRAWNFEAAQVAWKRIEVLLDRMLNSQKTGPKVVE